jgi:hypothetical protein
MKAKVNHDIGIPDQKYFKLSVMLSELEDNSDYGLERIGSKKYSDVLKNHLQL